MVTFVSMIRLTDQGMKDIQSTCKRAEDFRSSASEMGIEIKSLLWTMGSMDGVLLFDAPDEATATAAMLKLGASGNVHTQTSRAYGAEEMSAIVGRL